MAIAKVGLRKIKRKKGYVYQIDYTIDGIRKREVVGTNKSLAEKYQAKIQTDLMHGKLGVNNNTQKVSVKGLYDEFISLKQNLTDSSLARYRAYFDEFYKFIENYFPNAKNDITQIKTSYIRESINHLTKIGTTAGIVWSKKTANGYKVFLASLFKYAVKKKYLSSNPVSDIPNLKIEEKVSYEFFNENEIDLILEKIESHWKNYFLFILNTGLRKGEMNNLTWTNVNEKDRKITIASNDDWKTKGSKARIVGLNDTALNVIKEQKGKNQTYVFTAEQGGKVSPDKPYQALQRVLRKVGLKGDVHKFRHTFASNYMMKQAGTVYELQKILGHKDIETTQIYAHLAEEHLLDSLKKLDKK